MPELSSVTLEALKVRICRVFPAQVRAAVDALDDDQLWWRPNATSNSIGNLLLHLSGSLNYYLNRNVGGMEYERDRPAEFAERRQIPRAELIATFDDMVAKAEKTFASLTPDRIADPSPESKLYTLLVEDLIAVATHLANHTGQIVWIAKMMKDGALDDVWMRTHKRLGAWKRNSS